MARYSLSRIVALLQIACLVAEALSQALPPSGPLPGPRTDDKDEQSIEWNVRAFSALISAALVCALSMSAGIGGGGILVPIFNIILGLSIKQSTAVSQAVIASSGIGSVLFNLRQPHPLIDFDLALVLTPALLLGISIGVVINFFAPSWFITLSMISVLSYMSQRTFRLAFRMKSTERQSAALEALNWTSEDAGDDEDCALDAIIQPSPSLSGTVGMHPIYQTNNRINKTNIPWEKIIELLSFWSVFSALQIIKSKSAGEQYFLIYAAQIVVSLGATIHFGRRVVCKEGKKEGKEIEDWLLEGSAEYQGQHDENQQQLLQQDRMQKAYLHSTLFKKAVVIATIAGVIAAIIGLGGGFIMAGVLIETGMDPRVAAATSSLLVLFSSASATVSFAATGALDSGLACIFGIVCCISAFLGVLFLSKIVEKHGSSSIVFLLATMMAVGVVATLSFDVSRAIAEATSS